MAPNSQSCRPVPILGPVFVARGQMRINLKARAVHKRFVHETGPQPHSWEFQEEPIACSNR